MTVNDPYGSSHGDGPGALPEHAGFGTRTVTAQTSRSDGTSVSPGSIPPIGTSLPDAWVNWFGYRAFAIAIACASVMPPDGVATGGIVGSGGTVEPGVSPARACLLYTSDAADEEDSVDLG